MAAWIGLVVLGILIGCVHADQGVLQELSHDAGDDLATQVRSLQQNVTEVWTYIYRLRQAIEHHLTDITRRQSRLETSMHFQTMHGGHDSHGHGHHADDHSSHSGSGHQHEPLTSSSDHHADHGSSDHHDDHGASEDHHHDDHGSSDQHHDDHGSSDHHHDDHSSSDHHHDDHGSSDHHHDDHQHDSHSTSDDHSHHSDYHDDHHHDHHSTSESHTGDHGNHTDSLHSTDHGHDDHHHHHEGDHDVSHEKENKSPDDQQSVEIVERPFTSTVIQSHQPSDRTAGSQTQETSSSDPLNLLGSRSHHHHHHHHHSHDQQSYDTKVTIPKYSEYRQYIFATCDVQPNRVIPADLQQEVKGQVSFWQKKTGGPLNIHVRLRGFAIGNHHAHQQQQQQQTNEAPVHGAGHRHGFHVHEFADFSAGCQSTGPHYNPFNATHGGPKSSERHLGDLGNIECDDHGVTNIVYTDSVASLTGQYSIVGKALVIHADIDDYGVNKDDPESLRTGNAGTRIACCAIQSVAKLPLTTFKSMKTATNHQP